MYKNLKKISTKGMSKEVWLSHRNIGGSDVSTIFGLNKFKPAIKLFYEKVGITPEWSEDNIATLSGKVQEPTVASRYFPYWNPEIGTHESMLENISNKTPVRKCRRFNYIIENPDFPWLTGNIDRIILPSKYNKKRGILEIKTALKFANMQYEGVNPGYVLQIQTYLAITGLTWGEVFLLEDGRFPSAYEFDYNEEIIQSIIKITKEFWDNILQGREIWNSDLSYEQKMQELSFVEPDPDGTEACESFLKERYRADYQSNTLAGDSQLLETAVEYLKSREQIKKLEEAKKRAGNVLRQSLISNSANAIEFSDHGQVTWKTSNGRSTLNVQSKILKKYEEYADL